MIVGAVKFYNQHCAGLNPAGADKNEEDLDLFYDNVYTMLDLIKLLKKHLEPVKSKDGLFADLHQTVEKLHEAIILHIDIISTQEVKELQSRYSKAS